MSAPFTPEQEARVREIIAEEIARAGLNMTQRDKSREIAWDVIADLNITVGCDGSREIEAVIHNLRQRDSYEAKARAVFND